MSIGEICEEKRLHNYLKMMDLKQTPSLVDLYIRIREGYLSKKDKIEPRVQNPVVLLVRAMKYHFELT
jgi:hypothetical protein